MTPSVLLDNGIVPPPTPSAPTLCDLSTSCDPSAREDLPTLCDPTVLSARDTWTRLAPSLHVCDSAFIHGFDPLCLTNAMLEYAAGHMTREGYFQWPPIDWDLPLAGMTDIVRRLASMGAPPALAYHYDEFWLMFARLRHLLCALLGDDPAMLPEFWAWHVDPAQQEAGWGPHRDKGRDSLLDDGRPKAITLWLPLTEATPLNGCMYIVPADRDPTYGTALESQHRFDLADIRALPAQAGAVLGWDQAVLHWGSHAAARHAPPRISIACEFQRRDVAPFNEPLMDPRGPPDFATRQVLIGRQMLRYQHMVRAGADWEACADRMARGTADRTSGP
jgi:hypothetical protein